MSAPETNGSKASPYVVIVALVVLLTAAGLGYARFGDPAGMPPQMRRLAVTMHNPRAFQLEITPNWALLCRAWGGWLENLQRNAPRLLQTKELWTGLDDPVRVALAKFSANASNLRPEVIVPAAAGEKRLAVLGESPPVEVRNELLKYKVAVAVDQAYGQVYRLARQLEKWPHVEQELPGFLKAMAPAVPRQA